MHGAGGGAPKGNRNALKHGDFTAEALAMKKQINALSRMARETMGAIEQRQRSLWRSFALPVPSGSPRDFGNIRH
jgi:uncharacterized protein YjcR